MEAVAIEKPQIIALQEVNQSAVSPQTDDSELDNYRQCIGGAIIRRDNHVLNVVQQLADRGVHYHWTWLPIKRGYGAFDEGIALMSLAKILETRVITVSKRDDYTSWKTRKILGIRAEELPDEWFFSVHYSWWSDEDEPFQSQWEKTKPCLPRSKKIWLMGDFNNPAQIRGEGYEMIERDGWHDTYKIAKRRDCGETVGEPIDGWRERNISSEGMRIDQIWCNENADISSSEVLFNGERYPVVSDHYGVMIEYERSFK